MDLETLESELESKAGEKPSRDQLAKASGLSSMQLKRKLQHGRRAKEAGQPAGGERGQEVHQAEYGTSGPDPGRHHRFGAGGCRSHPRLQVFHLCLLRIRQASRGHCGKSRTIRLPIHITEMLNKLKKGQRELSQGSRTPTVTELAEFVELPEDDEDLMCRARQPVSLEMKVGDGDDTELLELLSGDGDLPSDQVEEDCLKGDLRSLLGQLPHLQEQVLRMRYGMDGEDPMSLTGIGRILGMSRDRVRNLERDGLAGLRRVSDQVEAYIAC